MAFQSLEKLRARPPVGKFEFGGYGRIEASSMKPQIGALIVSEFLFLSDRISTERLLAKYMRKEVPHFGLIFHAKQDLCNAVISVLKVVFEIEKAHDRQIGEFPVI